MTDDQLTVFLSNIYCENLKALKNYQTYRIVHENISIIMVSIEIIFLRKLKQYRIRLEKSNFTNKNEEYEEIFCLLYNLISSMNATIYHGLFRYEIYSNPATSALFNKIKVEAEDVKDMLRKYFIENPNIISEYKFTKLLISLTKLKKV